MAVLIASDDGDNGDEKTALPPRIDRGHHASRRPCFVGTKTGLALRLRNWEEGRDEEDLGNDALVANAEAGGVGRIENDARKVDLARRLNCIVLLVRVLGNGPTIMLDAAVVVIEEFRDVAPKMIHVYYIIIYTAFETKIFSFTMCRSGSDPDDVRTRSCPNHGSV